ncbi:MAG: adaptor protein MecA [Aerococcus sp.]|nr:adaptor protein MecA [Aerococcus sp.]
MEFEYLNENTMRVFIGADDLAERGVTLIDLLKDQSQVEKFFMSILEEADVSKQFQNSDAITFQVMPKKDGLDLYISKSSADGDDSEQMAALREILNDTDHSDESSDEEPNEESLRTHLPFYESDHLWELTLVFNDLNDVLALAQASDYEDMNVDLYHYEDRYFMTLHFDTHTFSQFEAEDIAYQFLEYGELSAVAEAILREHGLLLLEHTALQQLQYHLKNND